MSTQKLPEDKTLQQPKPDLLSQYRPLGLKAVLAASLMLKGKGPMRKKPA